MEATSFIVLAIIFVVSTILSDENVEKEPEFENLGLQEILNRFGSIWNIPSLQQLMYQEIGKFPQYEKNLSAAFNSQIRLLEGIESQCSESIEKAKKLIRIKIEDCKSLRSLEILKQQVEWVLKKIPEFNELFEAQKSKLNLTNKKKTKTDLFCECHSIDVAKKRFRRLSLLNHPDKGGSAAAMKEIINQYEECLKRLNQNNFNL